MRKAVLFALLLFVCSVQAANVTEFTLPYLYRWENYTRDVRVIPAALSSGNYSIVVINNTYTFVLNTTDTVSFVENTAQVESILREYYSKTVYPTKAELDALNSSFNSFLSSRNYDLECKVLTGLANPDGSPRFTCTPENLCESCQAVPVCRDVMKGTQETPDPMSSTLVKSIVRMQYDFNIMETNITKFKESIGNMGDVSQSLTDMKDSLLAIKSAVDDIGKPPVRTIYEQYTDYYNPKALGFCRNFYKEYNLSALNSAVSKAVELSNRVPTEAALLQQVSSIVTSTPERKINRTIREERESFDANYSALLERRNNITSKASFLLTRISDNETGEYIDRMDSLLGQILSFGDERKYEEANSISKNFSAVAEQAETHVSALLELYEELLDNNQSASDSLFDAWLRVPPEDFATVDRLNELYTQKASAEFMLNDTPLSLNETNALIKELATIRHNADLIKEERAALSAQQMNNLVVAVAKPIVSASLSILEPIIPLSYAEKERNATLLVGLALAFFDIILFLLCIGVFLYFIRSRRIVLHRVAKLLWTFIFAFIAFLLILSSLAVYNVADMQSHPTTYDVFLSELKESKSVGVVAELTGANGTIRDELTSCSGKLAEKLGEMNKSVMHYRFDGQDCLSGNETRTRTACENAVDAHPVIILKEGERNAATFQVLYTKKAVLEGDESFFRECMIARVVR